MVHAYRTKNSSLEVRLEKQKGESLSSSPLWQELEEAALHQSDMDKQWPCESVEVEAENYPYPYHIENGEVSEETANKDWIPKNNEEIGDTFDDKMNVKYRIKNQYNFKLMKHDTANG